MAKQAEEKVEKFVVRAKHLDKKEDTSIVMSLRMDKHIQDRFDHIAKQTKRSRNELMCKALEYALDNMKVEE